MIRRNRSALLENRNPSFDGHKERFREETKILYIPAFLDLRSASGTLGAVADNGWEVHSRRTHDSFKY